MNDAKKKPKPDPDQDQDDLSIFVDELPPLVEEVDEVAPESLADYLSEVDEQQSYLDDDRETAPEDPGAEIASELAHLEQESLIDDQGAGPVDEFDSGVDDEDEDTGWIDEGAGDALALDDDWFADEGGDSALLDGGEEGPLEDEFSQIDSSSWDDLGEDLGEEEPEPVDDVMDRLGIELPEADRDRPRRRSAPTIDSGVVLERQFIGPVDGWVEVIAVAGGAIMGAGDGIYLLGADGMLHRGPQPLTAHGISICGFGRFTFVGTANAGAFRFSSREGGGTPINGWNAVYIGEKQVMGGVTTTFRVAGQAIDDGYRLVGRTGEGQLFTSHDLGQTWIGPLTDGKCLCATPVEGTDEVLALVAAAGEPARLVVSSDLERWTDIPTPQALSVVPRSGRACLAATAKTIFAAADDETAPAVCSLDRGASWTEFAAIRGPTTLAVDPVDPVWLAAAVHDTAADQGLVRVSDDGGESWKTAAVTGRERSSRGRSTATEPRGRTTCMVVDLGRVRRLFVVAGEGVHQIVLARGGLTH